MAYPSLDLITNDNFIATMKQWCFPSATAHVIMFQLENKCPLSDLYTQLVKYIKYANTLMYSLNITIDMFITISKRAYEKEFFLDTEATSEENFPKVQKFIMDEFQLSFTPVIYSGLLSDSQLGEMDLYSKSDVQTKEFKESVTKDSMPGPAPKELITYKESTTTSYTIKKYNPHFLKGLKEAIEDVEELINKYEFYRAISIMSNLCMVLENKDLPHTLECARQLKETLYIVSTNSDPSYFEEHKQTALNDLRKLWKKYNNL